MKLDRVIAVRTAKTVYRDGDRCYKVFNAGYSKVDILNEALNLARIEETGLPVPKLLEVCMIDGKWAMVCEYIPGKSLSQLMKEEPDRRDAYLAQFVDIQMELQRKLRSMQAALPQEAVRDQQGKSGQTSGSKPCGKLERLPPQHGVCHGDFRPSNVIIREDGTPYVIDWSHLTQGAVSTDAAKTYLIFLRKGDLAGAERYLELFCEKSGIEKTELQRWISQVAAAQAEDKAAEACNIPPRLETAPEYHFGGRKAVNITVCIGSSCHIKGSRYVVEDLQRLIAQEKLGDRIQLSGSFCMGQCQRGVCVDVDGTLFSVSPETTGEFFEQEIKTRLQI